jgi:GT2 family glycosyltransferase
VTALLSICIVNWNTKADLEQALISVLEANPDLPVEVIVVDNASADGSAEMVQQRFPGVRLIRSAENLGFARGYNRAAAEATGRYLLLLNPDTITQSGAVRALVEFLDSHADAGAVGPRLLNRDGSLQYSCRRFPRPLAALFRNTPLGLLFPRNRYTREYLMTDWEHDAARPVDWISGAAMCLRREVWEQVGGFDEGFFMYAEDMDWCLRAHRAGWGIYYLPQAVVVHCIGRSSDQVPVRMVIQFHRSMARFYRKHHAPEWPFGVRWLPVLGIWLRGGLVLAETAWGLLKNRLRRRPERRERKAAPLPAPRSEDELPLPRR